MSCYRLSRAAPRIILPYLWWWLERARNVPTWKIWPKKLNLGPRVHFLGYRLDVDKILPHMDVFALPSFGEGFGLVLLEAMACSKPVVATRVMSIPEIVQQGETGLLVPAQDVSALAQALETIIENPELRDRFGKAGFQRVQSEFTVERMVRQTVIVYQEVSRSSGNERKTNSSLSRI